MSCTGKELAQVEESGTVSELRSDLLFPVVSPLDIIDPSQMTGMRVDICPPLLRKPFEALALATLLTITAPTLVPEVEKLARREAEATQSSQEKTRNLFEEFIVLAQEPEVDPPRITDIGVIPENGPNKGKIIRDIWIGDNHFEIISDVGSYVRPVWDPDNPGSFALGNQYFAYQDSGDHKGTFEITTPPSGFIPDPPGTYELRMTSPQNFGSGQLEAFTTITLDGETDASKEDIAKAFNFQSEDVLIESGNIFIRGHIVGIGGPGEKINYLNLYTPSPGTSPDKVWLTILQQTAMKSARVAELGTPQLAQEVARSLGFENPDQVIAAIQAEPNRAWPLFNLDLISLQPVPSQNQPSGPEVKSTSVMEDRVKRLNWNYDDIYQWARRLEVEGGVSIIHDLGRSYGTQQEIFALISPPINSLAEGGKKNFIFILGRVHPRERTSALVADEIFETLIKRQLTDNWSVVYLPLANPDALSREIEREGSGRKNLHAYPRPYETPGLKDPTLCFVAGTIPGVDLNRDFPPVWPGNPPDYMSYSAQNDPCHSMFPGDNAQEPETQAVMRLIEWLQQNGNTMVALDYHAWAEEIISQRNPNSELEKLTQIYADEAGYPIYPVSKYDSQGRTFLDWMQSKGINAFAVETGGGGEGFVPGEMNPDIPYYSADPIVLETEVGKHTKAVLSVVEYLTIH